MDRGRNGNTAHRKSPWTLPEGSRYKPAHDEENQSRLPQRRSELLILQLLERRPLHGYDLVQAIHDASGQKLEFGEGCIYPVLHRLEGAETLVEPAGACRGQKSDRVPRH